MIKKLVFFVLCTTLSIAVTAQTDTNTSEKKKGRPNIPGTFSIDFGLNLPSEKEGFNTSPFRSRTLNIYYYYDVQIGKSKFSIHPGIGFGLEKYGFNNNSTLAYDATTGDLEMVHVAELLPNASGLKKSHLHTNYIDIPFELRFSTNPEDPGRSFKVSLGFKVGVLYESFTRIKYREEGETKKLENKQNYNLNPFRYGGLLRVGVGSVSVFANYTLSPLFQNNKGPGGAEINNFTIGLTVAAF